MQSNAPRLTQPTQSLLQGKPYQRGADVQAVWRQHGWVPPSEQDDYADAQNFVVEFQRVLNALKKEQQ